VAHSRPPCPSTSDRLMGKPIPIPFAFVVKNGVKTRSASELRPVPESHTATIQDPDSSILDCTTSERARYVTAVIALG